MSQIRPSTEGDTPILVELARATGVFKPIEIQALHEVLDDYHATNRAHGHRSITILDAEEIIGFAYFAPAAMTEGTWYLYWIAVQSSRHRRGTGAHLLRHVEQEIRDAGGRLLLIETSSLPHYEKTRRFYLKHDYELGAVVRDYYADGDDMVVFRKRMAPADTQPQENCIVVFCEPEAR